MQRDENIAAARTEDSAKKTWEAGKETLKNAGDWASSKAENVKEDLKKPNPTPSSAEYARDDLRQSQDLGQDVSLQAPIASDKFSSSQGDRTIDASAQALGREDLQGSDWTGAGASSVPHERTWTEAAKEKFTEIKASLADTFKNPVASTEETTAAGLRKSGDVQEDIGRYLERDADKRRHQAEAEKGNPTISGSYSSNP